MGGALGNPIDEAAQQRINEKMQEAIKVFSIEFSKAYTQAVIQHAKDEVEPETSIEDDLKLQAAPAAGHILKTGILTKRGESVKSWKPRFFVAYNEKDNFKIDYHDGTSEAGKLKGTIYAAGYRVQEFTEDEALEFGEKGIKFVPWSYRRRTWYIKCGDDKERKEWMGVFETACYKSQPPHDEDACIAEAFDAALRNTRWHFWFWGWWGQAGNEAERLGEFILDLLDRDIVDAILDGVPNNAAKAMTVDLVRKTIGGSVKAAVGGAWTSSVTAVRSLSASIQSSVKDLLTPLLEKQKEFKNMIVGKISGTVNPFLADKGANLLKPVLNVVFKPVTDAFILAVQGFHSHFASKIASNEFAAARFQTTLDYSDWQMDWWSGPIHKGYVVVHRMYSDDFATIASLLVGGLTPYTVYNMVTDKLRLIIHRAVYTFGSLAKSIAESELPSVLSHVTSLLFHDILIMIKSVVMAVLNAVLDSPLNELVIKPCKDLILPLQETIDAIPIPGLSMLFNLNTMLEEVVYNVRDGAVDALISGSFKDMQTAVSVACAEIGVQALAV